MAREAPRLRAVSCRWCQRLREDGHAKFTPTCDNVHLELMTRDDGAYNIDGEGRMSVALASIIVNAVNAVADAVEVSGA